MTEKKLGPLTIISLTLLGLILLYIVSTMSSSTLLLNITKKQDEDTNISECIYNKTKDVNQKVAIVAANKLCCNKYCKTLHIDTTGFDADRQIDAFLAEEQDRRNKCSSTPECCQCYK